MNENKIPVNETEAESGISLFDFWMVLKKFFWRIAILTCLVTVITGVCCKLLVKAKYTASATIIVNPGLGYNNDNANASTEVTFDRNAVFLALQYMPSVINHIQTSKKVSNAIEQESQNNKGVESLKLGKMAVTHVDEQLQLTVSYTTTTSAEVAVTTVNKLVDVVCSVSKTEVQPEEGATVEVEGKKYIYQWANTLNVDDYAEKATPSNRWMLYTLLAFVISFILSYLYYFIMQMIDDTIKSKATIEKITGFHVMAYIENIDVKENSNNKKSSKKHSKAKA